MQRKVEPPNSPGKRQRLRSWTICELQDVYVDAPIVRQSCAMHSHDVAAGKMAAKFATPYLITLQWTGKACLGTRGLPAPLDPFPQLFAVVVDQNSDNVVIP